MKTTNHYKGHRWTESEIKTLMKVWSEGELLDCIASDLKVSRVAVLKQIQRLRANGIPLTRRKNGHALGAKNRAWTQGEIEYLLRRRNEKATSEEIAIELDRAPNAIDAMIQKLRKEGVSIAMRGQGVKRLYDVEKLKAVSIQMQS